MLILGLLLVVISGAAGVLLIAYNNDGQAQTVTMFGRDMDVTMMQAFLAGIAVALVFMIGLWMIMSAGRRARENRSRYREARKEAKVAAAERDELAEQIRHDETRREPVSGTDTMATPPAGNPVTRDRAPYPGPVAGEQPAGAPPQPRHTAPTGQQPVITNIKPGDSPTR